jgi:hypothetical protein
VPSVTGIAEQALPMVNINPSEPMNLLASASPPVLSSLKSHQGLSTEQDALDATRSTIAGTSAMRCVER